MNELCSFLHSSCFYSSSIRPRYVDLWKTDHFLWSFSLVIIAIKAGPMSMLIYLVWSGHWDKLLFHHKTLLIKPFKLTKEVYVRCLSRHYAFSNFLIQFSNAMCSVGPYIRNKFLAIIPKFLGAKLDKIPTRMFLQFLYLSFDSIQSWGGWLCFNWHDASQIFLLNWPKTISLAFHIWLQVSHGSVKIEGTMLDALSFSSLLGTSFPAKISGKHLCMHIFFS